MKNETFHQLISGLAAALRPIVPNGITMSADDRNLIVQTRHGYDWLTVVDNIEANLTQLGTDEAIEVAVKNCMNELQDVVTRHLNDPWPHPPGAARSEFADCGVEVRDGILSIWFGQHDAPVLPTIRIQLI